MVSDPLKPHCPVWVDKKCWPSPCQLQPAPTRPAKASLWSLTPSPYCFRKVADRQKKLCLPIMRIFPQKYNVFRRLRAETNWLGCLGLPWL